MNPQSQQEHYGDDKRPEYLAGLSICIVIIVLFVGARLYAQYLINQIWRSDNWLVVIAAVCTLATNALCIAAVKDGMGLHVYRVLKENPKPVETLIRFHKMGYAISVTQNICVMFVKLSILSFYHRVFTNRIRYFKISLIAVGVYVIILGIGSTVEFIVQCLPIHLFWARAYLLAGVANPHPVKGTCLPQALHVAFPLIGNIVSDVVILLLPAAGLWNLQMVRAKKFSVYFALSLGIFACAIEIVRICYALQIENGGDVTWTNAGSLIWSGVEPSVAIVCASIPAMAPLLRQVRPGQSLQHRNPHEQQRGPLRSKTYTNLYDSKIPKDDDSIRGLRDGLTPVHNGSLPTDDEYSCVAAYDSSHGAAQMSEPGIPMDSIHVSKTLDISRP